MATTGHHDAKKLDRPIKRAKNTVQNYNWAVYHKDMGNTKYIEIESTGNAALTGTFWNNTTPTNTMFSTGNNTNVNTAQNGHLWMGWASYPGICKVGSYSGNTDGSTTKFIECGFQPSFVLIIRNKIIKNLVFINCV